MVRPANFCFGGRAVPDHVGDPHLIRPREGNAAARQILDVSRRSAVRLRRARRAVETAAFVRDRLRANASGRSIRRSTTWQAIYEKTAPEYAEGASPAGRTAATACISGFFRGMHILTASSSTLFKYATTTNLREKGEFQLPARRSGCGAYGERYLAFEAVGDRNDIRDSVRLCADGQAALGPELRLQGNRCLPP